ncbi:MULTISPECIES: toxin-antitoxin system, toxin component, PIN family protein [Acinetobacter]|uniref:Toxin-antitoxin system, toxin component, PIN family protein n=1 Tax=Acinetobacter corruptisaponis TaxID=3045147 RepID=A0ABY8S811_9GAMM|nr:toxin-antitoxin system, toxin component, PIN family protein [Acinetobacter sp. KCTC 92772]WHP07233.1 toxin-antitoxin system, toxin component, PIN family protein [Acinetobacter sp. KCTC 92772]
MGISKALDSKFTDFEDIIQYFAALSFGCTMIVTRNIQDYKFAELKVVLPSIFID